MDEICEVCGRKNYPRWSARSSVWNQAVRQDGVDEFAFLCLSCFVDLATERGVVEHWTVIPDHDNHFQPETRAEFEFQIEALQQQCQTLEWLLEQSRCATTSNESEE